MKIKTILVSIAALVVTFSASYQIMKYFHTKGELGSTLGASTAKLSSTPSPSPILVPTRRPPKPSLTPLPSIFSTPAPTLPPQPRYVAQAKFTDEEIEGFINRFAGQYGVDAGVLRGVAECVSDFNPDLVNGPNVGLFQFNSITWEENRSAMGEDSNPNFRFNAEESTQTAAYVLSTGKTSAWLNCAP